jgi:hypothetical protein
VGGGGAGGRDAEPSRLRLLGRVLDSLETACGEGWPPSRRCGPTWRSSDRARRPGGIHKLSRSILGAEVAVSFREEDGGIFRVSFRSKGGRTSAKWRRGSGRRPPERRGVHGPGTLAEVKRKVFEALGAAFRDAGGHRPRQARWNHLLRRGQAWAGSFGKEVRHAGTLDPMATGVLPILRGGRHEDRRLPPGTRRSTKRRSLRVATDTGDATGKPVDTRPGALAEEREVAPDPVGAGGILHAGPAFFSAVKVGGVRSYALARRGKEVPLAPRRVTVFESRLLSWARGDSGRP